MMGDGEAQPFRFAFSFGGDAAETESNDAQVAASGALASPRVGSEGGSGDAAGEPDDGAACAIIEVAGLPPSHELDTSVLTQCVVTPDLSVWKSCIGSEAAAALVGTADVAHSDLVRGKYEGGFKVWEGGSDLAEFVAYAWRVRSGMFAAPSSGGGGGSGSAGSAAAAGAADEGGAQAGGGGGSGGGDDTGGSGSGRGRSGAAGGGAGAGGVGPALAGQRVMELGCGAGLPGLVALVAGADVTFQDYNAEVLERLTRVNVAANRVAAPGDVASAARFLAGDWGALSRWLQEQGLAGRYDVILSAETIYEAAGAARLYAAIKAALAPGGEAFIAAKSYYFGVGGSTAAFTAMVEADGAMAVEQAVVIDDGSSNKREILRLTFREGQ